MPLILTQVNPANQHDCSVFTQHRQNIADNSLSTTEQISEVLNNIGTHQGT